MQTETETPTKIHYTFTAEYFETTARAQELQAESYELYGLAERLSGVPDDGRYANLAAGYRQLAASARKTAEGME